MTKEFARELDFKDIQVPAEDFNKFICDYTLHHGRKLVFCYCLQAFRKAQTLKCHIIDCFKINGTQMIKIAKKINMLD